MMGRKSEKTTKGPFKNWHLFGINSLDFWGVGDVDPKVPNLLAISGSTRAKQNESPGVLLQFCKNNYKQQKLPRRNVGGFQK